MLMNAETEDVTQAAIKETKVAGPITVGDVLEKVSEKYDFSGNKPKNLHPLHRGLETTKFTFWVGPELLLLKIYDRSASSPPRFRLRNLRALENALNGAKVPISETVQTREDNSFVSLERRVTPNSAFHVVASVSKIFPGHALEHPTLEDVKAITRYIAMMHQIRDYGVVPAMDSWSLLRLVQTFDLDSRDENLGAVLGAVGSTIENVRTLALDDDKAFPKALVHGDLHPFNILKGSDGDYCILDLGCMDYEQRIADLAIFMSMTCADFADQAKTRLFFEAAVDTYQQRVNLTTSEKNALPVLIQANYAMFALRTAELLRDDPNNAEVRQFHERGMGGLRFMQELHYGESDAMV